MSPHALVTGGAGFIGSHLVDDLLVRGYRVTVLDNLSEQVHGDADVGADGWPIYMDRRARLVRGDILDEGVFGRCLDGVTHLVHLAASVGVGQSMSNIVSYTRNNVMSAAVVLEALSRTRHEVRRIALASSMSIYGEGAYVDPRTGLKVTPSLRTRDQLTQRRWELEIEGGTLVPTPTDETKPLQPASIYAINKRDHEEMFLAVGRALEIPTVALRLFNAYGSRQSLSNPYTGVAAIFISRLLNDSPPMVFEDGEQMRDFVHVQDVAAAFSTVLSSELEIWDTFNVGSGAAITVNEMAQVLARLLRRDIAPEILGRYRVGDIRHCYADISRIERVFGFKPTRSFERGMEELIAWVVAAKAPVDRGSSMLAELEHGGLVV